MTTIVIDDATLATLHAAAGSVLLTNERDKMMLPKDAQPELPKDLPKVK